MKNKWRRWSEILHFAIVRPVLRTVRFIVGHCRQRDKNEDSSPCNYPISLEIGHVPVQYFTCPSTPLIVRVERNSSVITLLGETLDRSKLSCMSQCRFLMWTLAGTVSVF